MSRAFESFTPGNGFEFNPDSVLNGNYGSRLEFKCRESRANLVNRHRIVAVHQHITTPITHSHYEQLDIEIGGSCPLSKNLQYPLLRILILHR